MAWPPHGQLKTGTLATLPRRPTQKPGRPSHHPLLAFVQETDAWLRSRGVRDITVRLDKGFFSRSMVRAPCAFDVGFLLKVPAHRWLRDHHHGPWRPSTRGEDIAPGGETWTASAEL